MKSFIFDLDGTLLDSMHIWDNIGEEFLKSQNIHETPQNLNEILKTMSLLEAAEYFISEFKINKLSQQICDEINNIIEDKYKNIVSLKNGVLEFLEKHKEKKMCIATATDMHLVEHALKRLKIETYFDFIITSTEVGNSKKEPDIFLIAAERLGTSVEECIIFEDALHAIKTSKKAGFYTVGVFEKSFDTEIETIKKYADQFVDKLSEVVL